MAIIGNQENVTRIPLERTVRVVIETPYTPGSTPDLYGLTIYRETRYIDSNGDDVYVPESPVSYTAKYEDIKDDLITINETTMSVGQVSAFIEKYCDQKTEELKNIQNTEELNNVH